MRLANSVRRIAATAVMALAGVFSLGSATTASASTVAVTFEPNAVIVNRSSKKTKVVLALPGPDRQMFAQHRSHSSHSSHASHRSHFSSSR